jgi:hypothetical protein
MLLESIQANPNQLQMFNQQLPNRPCLDLLFVCFKRQSTGVNFCNCFLFLENRGRARVLGRLGGFFIIYTHVKDRRGVRLGREERVLTCVRGFDLKFLIFFAGADGLCMARKFFCNF